MLYIASFVIILTCDYTFIALFNHVGRFHDRGICQLYVVSPPLEKSKNICFTIHTFMLTHENLGGVIFSILFTWNFVHPETNEKYWHYSVYRYR